jgi:hypothetical protein
MQFLPAWLNQQRNSAKVAATESSLHSSSSIKTSFQTNALLLRTICATHGHPGIFVSFISGLEGTSPPEQYI